MATGEHQGGQHYSGSGSNGGGSRQHATVSPAPGGDASYYGSPAGGSVNRSCASRGGSGGDGGHRGAGGAPLTHSYQQQQGSPQSSHSPPTGPSQASPYGSAGS